MDDVLLVAATEGELAPLRGGPARAGIRTLVCGIGPVAAAVAVARELALDGPVRAVVCLGTAGVRPGRGLAIGDVVVGDVALLRLGVGERGRLLRRDADPALLDTARAALPEAQIAPIETVLAVGAGADADVEAMEGFAVLEAARAAGIPAIEVRAISNLVTDPRERWRLTDAAALAAEAAGRLAAAVSAGRAVPA